MKAIIIVVCCLTLLLTGCMCDSYQISNENKQQYCSSQIKFCDGKGMQLNDTYYLESNQFIVCKNATGLATYEIQHTPSKDGDSFGTGLLVGWLLFK